MYKIVLQERRGEEMHQGQVCDRGSIQSPLGDDVRHLGQILESESLNENPASSTFQLCDLGKLAKLSL